MILLLKLFPIFSFFQFCSRSAVFFIYFFFLFLSFHFMVFLFLGLLWTATTPSIFGWEMLRLYAGGGMLRGYC